MDFTFDRLLENAAQGRQTLRATIRALLAADAAYGPDRAGSLSPDELLAPHLIAWLFSSKRSELSAPRARQGTEKADDGAGMRLPGTDIALVQSLDPMLLAFLHQNVRDAATLRLSPVARTVPAQLQEAVDLLDRYAPSHAGALRGSVRSVLLFEHDTLASFAALQMHGMIFVNVQRPLTTPFFVDALVHQGGHVIFSEATLDRERYFRVHPDTPLRTVTHRDDTRSMYEALHGIHTEYVVLDAFDRIRNAPLTEEETLEVSGRSQLMAARLRRDLQGLRQHAEAVLSPDGAGLLDFYARESDRLGRLRPGSSFDVSGQPEDFDFEEFVRRNPSGQRASARVEASFHP